MSLSLTTRFALECCVAVSQEDVVEELRLYKAFWNHSKQYLSKGSQDYRFTQFV